MLHKYSERRDAVAKLLHTAFSLHLPAEGMTHFGNSIAPSTAAAAATATALRKGSRQGRRGPAPDSGKGRGNSERASRVSGSKTEGVTVSAVPSSSGACPRSVTRLTSLLRCSFLWAPDPGVSSC